MRRLVLIDGSGFIFRAYHALPPLTTPSGEPVGAVHGYVAMLLKLLDEIDADLLAVVFDATRASFRNQIYPDYKANRPQVPEDLVPQFSLIREATAAFNVPCVEMENYEADDLIASYVELARAEGMKVTIVSSDKDMMQLIDDDVEMLDVVRNRVIGRQDVAAKFGVGPERVVDVQALAGDSVDNVPGVPGIGIKTAALLITEYGDLDALLARADDIKQPQRRRNLIEHAERAHLSRALVTLKRDVPPPAPLENFTRQEPQANVVAAFLSKLGFKRLLARFDGTVQARRAHSNSKAYEMVQDVATLGRWIEEAHASGMAAIHSEVDTTNTGMIGLALSTNPGRACYIPLRHVTRAPPSDLLNGPAPESLPQIPLDGAACLLKPLFENLGVIKVGADIKRDIHALHALGIDLNPVDDVLAMSCVLDGATRELDVANLAARHLGLDVARREDVCGKGKSAIPIHTLTLEQAMPYACANVDAILRLSQTLRQRLVDEKMMAVYETLDRPAIRLLARMEQTGIKVDVAVLRALSDDFARRMAHLDGEIQELAGETFNVGSPKQLGDILFNKLSLPGGRKSRKTKAWITDATTLEQLEAEGHALPSKILRWRRVQKLRATYADALLKGTNPATGRVHTTFSLTSTSTGRLSSSHPNLQNIPIRTEDGRKIRRAFIAPPGQQLLSADYSQIELRLIAHIADVKALKAAFHQGEDIHATTAHHVFGVPVDNMDLIARRQAKAVNFGIIYGVSAFGLGRQLGISNASAQQLINTYFERFPEILDYCEHTRQHARTHNYVTTFMGRKCFIPDILSKNAAQRAFAERAAINAPVQGGAADIIKRAMAAVPQALAAARLRARMLLQVHDELVFEVPSEEVECTRNVVVATMENAAHLSVPLTAQCAAADNWAQAH